MQARVLAAVDEWLAVALDRLRPRCGPRETTLAERLMRDGRAVTLTCSGVGVEHSISYSNPTELQERIFRLADAASNVARLPR
jgi:hypothetical protein